MSDSPVERFFQEQVAQAVAELRQGGWIVWDLAGNYPDWLPMSIQDLDPDIVARRGNELLIGEVKSRHSAGLEDLDELAKAVAEIPNARLEVYWLGDEPLTEPTLERIRKLAAEARTLAATEHLTAAIVIAWAALEGALERYATDTQAPVTTGSERAITAWPLLSRLYSLGYVSEGDFGRLGEVRKQRNAAVHFGPDAPPKAQDVAFTLALVDRLVSGQYVSVDQMMEWYIDHFDYPQSPTDDTGRVMATVLTERFRGASPADVQEAVARLLHDAAI